jgi:hypothetical protein
MLRYDGLMPFVRTFAAIIAAFLIVIAPAVHAEVPGVKFTSILDVSLGVGITFQNVIDKLGPATMMETGDAGNYQASLCYKSKNGFVRFLSNEIGGADHEVMGFIISQTVANRTCSPLPASYAGRDLNLGGLTLGMKSDDFIHAVGGYVERRKNIFVRTFSHKVLVDDTDFDDVITVDGAFSGGHLTVLEVWRTETD